MIRDQIECFELTDDTLRKHPNEHQVLSAFFHGLEFLYEMVKQAEMEARHRFAEKFGTPPADNAPARSSTPPAVRICAFHWYATTACNFVKLVGWFRQRQDPNAESAADYLGKVLPEVEIWRNKVSAHLAVHTPLPKDTPADFLACLIPPTALVDGRYVAGNWAVSMRRAGQTSTSRLRPWSLTEVHEQLRARYGLSSV